MNEVAMLDLKRFYPEELKIIDIDDKEGSIKIRMKSVTHSCKCIKCGSKTEHYHGTYIRNVQDLPILGKTVRLEINAHEYTCDNPDCDTTTFAESFDGFLNYYSRMTERCADFICTLALETSCEGSARICQSMNLKISGDSVIRLLIKRYHEQPEPECGNVIGVDDFAFMKRHTYGTIIVDGETHKPITILDGRDGEALKAWLKNNKQVKMVTRDRASAYSTAIKEILPDAMQIADRFHLHQNLLEAIRNTINAVLPVDIKIPKEVNNSSSTSNQVSEQGKKNATHCG
ncbi:MAG: ISL3 family transposase [Velocimicrobium sp.]